MNKYDNNQQGDVILEKLENDKWLVGLYNRNIIEYVDKSLQPNKIITCRVCFCWEDALKVARRLNKCL